MGAENSSGYNREEKIKKLEKKSNEIRDYTLNMYNEPKHSTSEILDSWKKKDKIDEDINRLKKMNETEKNFSKNINFNDYRNSDGTFNVYKTKRSLNYPTGEASGKVVKILHHEGIAIGNGKKMFYSDYGVGEGDLEVRFWDGDEEKDKWKKIEKVRTSKASDDKVKEILFGEKSEKWTNRDDYKLLKHNCQDYSKEKIADFIENENKNE